MPTSADNVVQGESNAEGRDRRQHDHDWKNTMEEEVKGVKEKLGEGVEKFTVLEQGQKTLMGQMEANTEITLGMGRRLDDHIAAYGKFTEKVDPAIRIIETGESFFAFLGKVGDGFAFVARNARKTVIWLAPFITFGVAIWGYLENWFGIGRK